jgi:hypothetical protein
MSSMSIFLFITTTALVAGATAAMLSLGRRATRTPLGVSALPYANSQARYQLWLPSVAVLVVLGPQRTMLRSLPAYCRISPGSGSPR